MHRNETLFYVFGIGLAVSAVVFSFLGLKVKGFPGRAFPAVVAWFAILIIGATTFSVLHAQDEEKAKAAETEKANEEFEADDADIQAEEAAEEEEAEEKGQPSEGGGAEAGGEAAAGSGGTLQLAADPAAIAYDTTELTSKPGKVTIDFDNPAPLEHDVVVEDEAGDELARSEIVTESETSAEADLAAGSYTFFCSIPGHREAGMEGTLTVK